MKQYQTCSKINESNKVCLKKNHLDNSLEENLFSFLKTKEGVLK